MLERVIRDKNWYKKTPGLIKWICTVTIVFFSWILFSSASIKEAGQTIYNMFVPMTRNTVNFTWRYYLSNSTLFLLIIAVAGHIFAFKPIKSRTIVFLENNFGILIKRILFILLFVADILYVVNSTYSPFLYFRF